MVPRENKNNAYAKFGGTNKEYYGILPNGLSNHANKCLRFRTGLERDHTNDCQMTSLLRQ